VGTIGEQPILNTAYSGKSKTPKIEYIGEKRQFPKTNTGPLLFSLKIEKAPLLARGPAFEASLFWVVI